MTAILDDETVLVMHRRFDASPEQVFDAWATLEGFQAWIGPPGVQCDVSLFEPRAGGSYALTMRLSTGQVMPIAGEFRALSRPARLALTWGWDGDPNRQSLITITFQAEDGGTEMTFRQEGLGSAENRDGHERGWTGAFIKLADYLDRG